MRRLLLWFIPILALLLIAAATTASGLGRGHGLGRPIAPQGTPAAVSPARQVSPSEPSPSPCKQDWYRGETCGDHYTSCSPTPSGYQCSTWDPPPPPPVSKPSP